jgi:hypothetical protein
MNWETITNWFDKFHDETIEGRLPVRGRVYSGAKIEIWGKNDIVIVLVDPRLRGATITFFYDSAFNSGRALDMVKTSLAESDSSLYAEIKYDRFQRIVSGEEPLTDSDWIRSDE